MAASVRKSSISFGLVSVPIKVFASARYSHISFHAPRAWGTHNL